jgi:hypothetical protein
VTTTRVDVVNDPRWGDVGVEAESFAQGGPCAASVALAERLPDRGGELKARERAVPPAEDDSYQLPEPLIDALRALWRLSPPRTSAPRLPSRYRRQ